MLLGTPYRFSYFPIWIHVYISFYHFNDDFLNQKLHIYKSIIKNKKLAFYF